MKYLVFAIVLFIPLQNIVEKVPNLFGIYGLGIVHIAFGLAIILLLLVMPPRDSTLGVGDRLGKAMLVFLVYFFFEVFATSDAAATLVEKFILWKTLLLSMAGYFIVSRSIRSKKDLFVLLLIMVLANVYMDFYYWRSVRWYGFASFNDKYKSINGTFGSVAGSNEWAAFFSTYTFVLIAVVSKVRRSVMLKWLLIALIAFNVRVLLFSFSRGAYVAFVVGSLWYFGMKKRYGYVAVFLVCLVGYEVLLPSAVVERVNMWSSTTLTGQEEDADIRSRKDMWEIAVKGFLRSPVIGNGLGSFRFGYADSGVKWKNPHNQHLSILYQGGAIGYLLFLVLFVLGYRNAMMLHRTGADELTRALGYGVAAATVSLFVANVFGDRWSYLPLTGYYWVLQGIVYSIQRCMGVGRKLG